MEGGEGVEWEVEGWHGVEGGGKVEEGLEQGGYPLRPWFIIGGLPVPLFQCPQLSCSSSSYKLGSSYETC